MTAISGGERAQLDALAGLLRARISLNVEIARWIGRPASTGNLGEFIAARIFDITLAASGVNPGHEGFFASGPIAGKSVNVKMYSQDDALLDIGALAADYYLVLRGPRASATKGPRTLPFRNRRRIPLRDDHSVTVATRCRSQGGDRYKRSSPYVGLGAGFPRARRVTNDPDVPSGRAPEALRW